MIINLALMNFNAIFISIKIFWRIIMKKYIVLILMAAFVLAFSLSACGGKNKSDSSNTDSQTQQTDSTASTDNSGTAQSDTSSSKITNDEVSRLADNEFYILNSTSKGISELRISPTGNNEWGSSLISSTVSSGSKILVSLGSADLTTRYDIRVVADNGETTEYTGFDMKSTVQITFYDNAQCDVDSI